MPRAIPTIAATVLSAATLASPAGAMPIDPPVKPARPHVAQTATLAREVSGSAVRSNVIVLPDHVDATRHAATIRGIGAALAERAH